MSAGFRLLRIAAAILLAIAAASVGAADRIAYESRSASGTQGIVLSNAHGDNPIEFRHPGGDGAITPDLSVDGSRLTYAAKVGARYRIFMVPLAGDGSIAGDPVQMTSGDSDDEQPVLSPDGRRIAWVSTLDQARTLWVRDVEGGPVSEFAKLGSDLHSAAPSWSPDGLAIVFSRDGRLWITHLDLARINELYDDGLYPSWSPDGREIAFFSKARSAVMVISPTTKTIRTLATKVQSCGETAWSPDGRFVAFKADRVGGAPGGLWVVPTRGGEVKPLPTAGLAAGAIAWSWDPASAPVPPATSAAPTAIIKGPYLQQVTQTTQVVMWETDVAGPSAVDYGTDTGYGQTATDDRAVTVHEVKVNGLTPNTQYHYQVRSGGVGSTDSTFHTAVPKGTPFRFVVCSDNGSVRDIFARIADGILGQDPAFVLHVGDTLINGDIYEQWGTLFFRPADELMRRVPVYIAMGNHDHDSRWFHDFFSYPPPENYYSFDYGSLHVVCVDSMKPCDPGSAQYEWLERDLASEVAQTADWRLVAFHVPGVMGPPDNAVRTYLMPLFTKWGVDMVFNGHMHNYQRRLIDGVYYIITGGAGQGPDVMGPGSRRRVPQDVAAYSPLHHYCVLDIDGPTLNFKVVSIDNQVLDSLVLTTRPRPRG